MGVKCFICGDSTRLRLRSTPQSRDVFKDWTHNWAVSLCSILELDSSCQEVFSGASFCVRCQETVCNAEFTFNSITQLQVKQRDIRTKVRGLLRRNYKRIVATNLDECVSKEDSIEFILKRIKMEFTQPAIAVKEIKEEQRDGGEFILPNLPSKSRRLMKRKQRQCEGHQLEQEEIPTHSANNAQGVSHLPIPWNFQVDDQSLPVHIKMPEVVDLVCREQFSSSPASDRMEEDEDEMETSCNNSQELHLDEFKEEEKGIFDISSLQEGSGFGAEYETFEDPNGTVEDSDEMERCDTAQQLEESTGITNSVASSSTEQSQTASTCGVPKRVGRPMGSRPERTPAQIIWQIKRQNSAEAFSNRGALVRHICNYPDCLSRNLGWPRPRLIREHILSEHNGEGCDTPYHCSECPLRFGQYEDLQRHIRVVHRGKTEPIKPTCSHCGRSCQNRRALHEHESICRKRKTDTSTAPKKCKICSKLFDSPDEMQFHEKLHVGKESLDCVLCKFPRQTPYKNKTELSLHVARVHNKIRNTTRKGSSVENLRKAREAKMKMANWELTRKLAAQNDRKKQKSTKLFTVLITPITPYTKKCEVCSSAFATDEELDQHKELHQSHSEDAPSNFNCVFCEKEFTDSAVLSQHVQGAHQNLHHSFICNFPTCRQNDVAFLSTAELKAHLVEKHESSPEEAIYAYHCKYCDFRYKKMFSLRQHMSRSHGKEERNGHLCAECGKIFGEEWILKRHIRKTHERLPTTPRCAQCNKTFDTDAAAQEHEELHSISTPFDCVLCESKMRTTAELQTHVMWAHESKSYKCPAEGCETACMTKQKIKLHYTTNHAKTTPHLENIHKCPRCDFRTKNQTGLKYHMLNKHTSRERLKCSVEGCTKESSRQEAMDVHLKIVHKIGDMKIWSCRICGKEYATKHRLADHEEQHGTARPHACEICAATFKTKRHLIQHWKVHASGKTTKNNWKLQQPRKPRLTPVTTTVSTHQEQITTTISTREPPPPTYTKL